MPPPPRIGRYQIVELLGQGAMGVVYRGRDEGLDRDVAVKVVRGEAVDDESRAQFLKEARAAARLQHPGIVTIYELGEQDGAPYLAMELLDGQDLQHAMRDGAWSNPRRALEVIEQVLAALGHAHARGIVHRDMKPSNVFLHGGARAKILDFGVARLGEGMTVTGRIVGTPHYMSPEQIRADKVDGRSDLFSTALMFYEMVTGTKAYRPGSAVSVMYQIVHEDADLSRLPPSATGVALLGVLRRALARDRNDRYPDAAALAAALAEAVRGHADEPEAPTEVELPELELRDLTPVAPLRIVEPEPLDSVALRPVTVAPPPLRGSPRPRAAVSAPPASRRAWVSAAVVLLIAAGGAWWWRTGGARPQPSGGEPRATAPEPTAVAPAPPATGALEPSQPEPTTEPAASPSEPAAGSPVPAPGSPSPVAVVPTAAPASLAPRATAEARPSGETRPTAPASKAPVDAQARLERADQLFQSGRLVAALAEARAVLREQPDNAEAKYLAEDIELDLAIEDHLKKARAALARGDREGARREAEAGLQAKPNESRLTALLRQLDRQ